MLTTRLLALFLSTLSLIWGQTHAVPLRHATRHAEYVPDQVLVKFKSGITTTIRAQTALGYGAKSIRSLEHTPQWSVTTLSPGQTVTQALSLYANDPNVEYAQPNYIYRPLAKPSPSLDPDYNQLWAVKNSGQAIKTGIDPASTTVSGTPGDDMNLEAAWNIQTDCSSVTVAVLDMGVNYNAVDLAGNMWNGGATYPNHGWNFVENNNDPMDYVGHGTHIAGTIGAQGGNGIGIAGVCWKASIMAVRVMDATGATIANIIQGMNFAIAHGAKILNMSLGGNTFDKAFSDAITSAKTAGILVVVAAGNEASNNDATPMYPCSFTQDNILCVAALDQNYALASFSNWGNASVDVGAPGVNIRSTWAGTQTTISDPLTTNSGWNFSSTTGNGWGFGIFNQPGLTNPKNAWGFSSSLYAAATDDRTYKAFSLPAANTATLHIAAAANVRNGDYFNANLMSGTGDPFAGGASIYSGTNLTDGLYTNTTITQDVSNCINTTCSIGLQLRSLPSSTRATGVAVPYFGIDMLTWNNIGYYVAEGTSMATPQVTGLAALVWAHNPAFTYMDVANAIKQGGRSIPALAGKTTTGKAVDALGALTYINQPTGITVHVQ